MGLTCVQRRQVGLMCMHAAIVVILSTAALEAEPGGAYVCAAFMLRLRRLVLLLGGREGRAGVCVCPLMHCVGVCVWVCVCVGGGAPAACNPGSTTHSRIMAQWHAPPPLLLYACTYAGDMKYKPEAVYRKAQEAAHRWRTKRWAAARGGGGSVAGMRAPARQRWA